MIMISFTALLAVASLDAQLLHHLGDLTPLGYAPLLEQLLQDLVFLNSQRPVPQASKSFASSF